MSFKLPDSFEDKKKKWYELQHVTYKGKKIHPSKFEDKSVTKEQLKDMRINSYGQEEMFRKYTDDVLIDKAKYYISNCSRPSYPCTTYDEALIHLIVPELAKRLSEYKEFYDYFSELYGQGLEVANWHINGDLEPFDDFFDAAEEEMKK